MDFQNQSTQTSLFYFFFQYHLHLKNKDMLTLNDGKVSFKCPHIKSK